MVVGLISAASACWLGDYQPPTGHAGGPAQGREVHCGDDTCGPSEVCCLEQDNASSAACTAADACMLFPIPCDDPDDCAHLGGVCCGLWDESASRYTAVECSGACSSSDRVPICRLDNDADCPTGRHCKEERLFGPGFGFCAP
ncbi:hypothetical protein E8A74_51110 [Polyangium fumosum]|uniref:Uncharacterized protein n=2 Tax=Polyangium fumosum TaxID=889272 RepID=A0A4U1IAA0_9BACT|nr:hypothetical protein E8A74_51110 [Polyangium fumosum]